MSYLLDTNAWIFFFEGDRKFNEHLKQLISEESENCYVSMASVWEAAIKCGIGKLDLAYSLQDDLPRLFDQNGFSLLPLEAEDVLAVETLPPIHRDPFDRIQAVQCQRRGWQIIRRDPIFDAYDLKRLW